MKPSVSTLAALAILLSLPLCAAAPARPAAAQAPGSLPTIAAATAGLERRPGLLTFYLDRQKGKVWLEVPPATGEDGEGASYPYQEGLLTGLGTNPEGLDRGQLGGTRIVHLHRVRGRGLVERRTPTLA